VIRFAYMDKAGPACGYLIPVFDTFN